MMRNAKWALGSNLRLLGAECRDERGTVSAVGERSARCPGCDVRSTRRHGWQVRTESESDPSKRQRDDRGRTCFQISESSLYSLTGFAVQDRMQDLPTKEENILYLMQELDQALEQGEPKWTPRQVNAARRLGTALGPKLRELVAKLLEG
jgi:hypothetical protein